jgi:hypothetical protein
MPRRTAAQIAADKAAAEAPEAAPDTTPEVAEEPPARKQRTVLERLAERFDSKDVEIVDKGRRGKFHFIGIEQTITRLNDVLGLGWSLEVTDSRVEVTSGGYMATVTVKMGVRDPKTGEWTYRSGVGADIDGKDADKASKTALASALKKAGNLFGIALYLWDAEERALLDTQNDDSKEGIVAKKQAVAAIAVNQGVTLVPVTEDNFREQNLQLLAKHFGLTVDDLDNPDILNAIIQQNR